MDEEIHEPLLHRKLSQYSFQIFKTESGYLLDLAWPVITNYILGFLLNFSSVISLGHLGTRELAASALATMFCNVTGFSLGQGLASALDTLCSQAFTGSSDPHALGKHLQRSIVLMFLLSVPISFLWMYLSPVLQLLGQDPILSDMAQTIARYLIPGFLPYLISDCMKRYMQGQA